MANNMVGCRAGAGTDINPFALDFGDWSWGEAAPQQVVWLWVPSHSPSAAFLLLPGQAAGQRSPALLTCGSFCVSRHSEGFSEAGTDSL